jgi:hypothetical protein
LRELLDVETESKSREGSMNFGSEDKEIDSGRGKDGIEELDGIGGGFS